MYSFLILAFVSFTLSFLLTPLVRNVFRYWGVVDHPDKVRKIHSHAVPRVGGIPILLSYVAAYAILLLSPLKAAVLVSENIASIWKLFPAVTLVFLTGLIDDVFGLKPWQKMIGQFAAAVWAYSAGVRILGIAGYSTEAWWSFPLTFLWLIACTNAFNLIDGVDGLAAGIGFFATLTTFTAALSMNHVALALATAPLVGSLLAFLRYNFNPASIFLGDCGSLTIGFLLGCFGVIWSHKSTTLLGMTAPLMALSVPILDVCLSIVRRFLSQRPIFAADRGHIHHRLLDRGLTPKRVAIVLYGACGLAAALSLAQSMIHHEFAGIIIVIFCAVTYLGVQNLGYAEFGVARQMLMEGTFLRLLNEQVCLNSFEKRLMAANNWDECWMAIRDAYQTVGFNHVRLHIANHSYEDGDGTVDVLQCWNVTIDLCDTSYCTLMRKYDAPVRSVMVSSFVDVLREVLVLKLKQIHPLHTPSVAPFPSGDASRIPTHMSQIT